MKYPMTYEEFRSTVRELFIKELKDADDERALTEYLDDNEDVIENEYAQECYSYDKSPKERDVLFTNDGIFGRAVNVLIMLY